MYCLKTIPNWTIASRISISAGRTSANSTTDCPRWFLSETRCAISVYLRLSGREKGRRRLPADRGPRRPGETDELRDRVGDAGQHVADVRGEEHQRRDDRRRDDGEDDAVLGHRLTLLALQRGRGEG